jgi:glycosyltransferase involved in cell wall biosynthesis
MELSIVIPAKNEEQGLALFLPELMTQHPHAEVIVVNDGSTDSTAEIAEKAGAKVVTHHYSLGNGAAIKSGARAATGDVIVFMDGDGQHQPEDISRLMAKIDEGFDMVVGARSSESQASVARNIANTIYNKLATYMVSQKVDDLTSGFRAVRAEKFKEFLSLLPNGFSYPTTITMSFFRSGYSVEYIPIVAKKRLGNSHINILKDGVRFLLIIFKVATLFSPLKLFVPISFGFFSLAFSYYMYTFLSDGRFTNMGVLLFTTSIIIFLLGLVSEQITTLTFMQRQHGYGDLRARKDD